MAGSVTVHRDRFAEPQRRRIEALAFIRAWWPEATLAQAQATAVWITTGRATP